MVSDVLVTSSGWLSSMLSTIVVVCVPVLPGDKGDAKARMHDALTVGVIAMNKDGEVGAASTLGPHNVHRGRPAFPFVVRVMRDCGHSNDQLKSRH